MINFMWIANFIFIVFLSYFLYTQISLNRELSQQVKDYKESLEIVQGKFDDLYTDYYEQLEILHNELQILKSLKEKDIND